MRLDLVARPGVLGRQVHRPLVGRDVVQGVDLVELVQQPGAAGA